jgi:adenine-specific DNA-methyltransferase
MTNFDQKLKGKLKQNMEFWDEEIDDINRNEIIDGAYKVDKDLIGILIRDKEIRETFFDKIEEYWVFNVNKFVDYIENIKILSNSYTKFKNIVGLNVNGKYLNERGGVSLVWPFKDCVLEGGMTKEDQKRNEIFFNEILAKDEIDRLFDAKVLTNFKKYTAKGEEKVKYFNRDGKGTIKDNLIIKGNNLLALHFLKKEFAGKVKLIYIDPPYNTGGDSFKYNDNFNHSTWLTFMKNRLEVARDLLRDDGVIFVQCDDNEQAYLKILMDDIFSGNFLNTISVKAKVSSGASGGGEDKRLKKNIEYVHCYYKKLFSAFNDIYKKTEIENYINSMKLNNKSFKYTNILISEGKKKYLKTIKDGSGGDIKIYSHSGIITKTVNQIKREENLSIKKIYTKYFNKIFTTTNPQSSIRKRVWDAVGNENEFYSIEYYPKSGKNKGKLTIQYYSGKQTVLLIWFKDSASLEKDGNVVKKEKYGTFWDGFDYINMNREGEVSFSSGKKPEGLIQRIIDMSTQKGEIVLDYHLGSGTTCAVAHKMGRHYIGIEQLDYGKNDSVVRLKNIIGKINSEGKLRETIEDFDNTGISKSVNWKGGGEFIYCELLKYNEEAIDKIQEAKDTKTLLKIWDEMCDKYFLTYDVEIKKFNDNKKDFEKMTLKQQKDILVEMLNKNQLYVNLSEIEDSQFKVSKEDKELNKKFYEGK